MYQINKNKTTKNKIKMFSLIFKANKNKNVRSTFDWFCYGCFKITSFHQLSNLMNFIPRGKKRNTCKTSDERYLNLASFLGKAHAVGSVIGI